VHTSPQFSISKANIDGILL
jgi:hypothetical protein